MTPPVPRANFTISQAALSAIAALRRDAEAQGVKPSVAMIGWGRFMPFSGSRSEAVVVGFYPEEQYESIEHGVQTVSGLDLVFFVTEEDALRFEGRVLDRSVERGYHLR
jgi:hypothetical protein